MRNLLPIVCLLAFTPLSAQAQIYMCKDAAGKTYTSDRAIPECQGRAFREYDKKGSVRKDVAAPLTAEQKRQKDEEEEKRKADKLVADEQRKSDRAITARFRSEADIEGARKRELELVQDPLKREAASLADTEKLLKDAQTEAALPANKKAMPPALQRRLESTDQAAKDQKKRVLQLEGDLARINEKYDATLKRYRELVPSAATATPVSAPAPAPAAKK